MFWAELRSFMLKSFLLGTSSPVASRSHAFCAVCCLLFVGGFFFTHNLIYRVKGSSMEPTVGDGSYVLTLPLLGISAHVGRNKVVLLEEPWGGTPLAIKRIVGVPGDCVTPQGAVEAGSAAPCTRLSEGSYFVVGDNPYFSSDSRTLGNISSKSIIGRAICTVWPPNQFRIIR